MVVTLRYSILIGIWKWSSVNRIKDSYTDSKLHVVMLLHARVIYVQLTINMPIVVHLYPVQL